MEQQFKLISKVFNYISKSENLELKKEFSISFIKIIKNIYILNMNLENEDLKILYDMIANLKDEYEKMQLINIMLDILYDIGYDDIFKQNLIEDMLNLFLNIIDDNKSNHKIVAEIVEGFMICGIKKEKIFLEFAKRFKSSFVIEIFSNTIINNYLDEWELKTNQYGYLIENIKKNLKLNIRMDLVSHFMLMINPKCANNLKIITNYFNRFSTYRGVCSDWVFSSKSSAERYAKKNILTIKEAKIFDKLGDLYLESQDLSIPTDTEEELYKFLDISAERFKDKLDCEEIRNMYEEFFEEKDFFEVALSIPEK